MMRFRFRDIDYHVRVKNRRGTRNDFAARKFEDELRELTDDVDYEEAQFGTYYICRARKH